MTSQSVHHHHHASRTDSTSTSHFDATLSTADVSNRNEIVNRGALSDEALDAHTASSQTLFVDLMEDLQSISSTIESVEQHVRVRRQQRRSVRSLTGTTAAATAAVSSDQPRAATKNSSYSRRKSAPAAVASSETQGHASTSTSSGAGNRDRSGGASQRRKKDDYALDCIYAELQDTVGMCRYWGKKCWNLRVPKAKGGFHSLCHMHRVKANDNQRRFDYKRRGTLWRSFKPDPNYEDVSLFPGVESSSGDAGEHDGGSAAANFEPFEQPVALQEKDVELLHELIGATSI